jgi:hypothetical protein
MAADFEGGGLFFCGDYAKLWLVASIRSNRLQELNITKLLEFPI